MDNDEEEEKYTIEEIRQKCINYDSLHGEYPESCLEGMAIFKHIIETDWNMKEYMNDLGKKLEQLKKRSK